MNSKINYMKKIGENATTASSEICNLKTEKKNSVLNAYNKNLKRFKKEIVLQNNKDVKAAINKKLSNSMIDRLMLNENRIDNIINSISEIIELEDPVGKILSSWKRPNGIVFNKISIPLGVIGIIYESRPNVTCDVSALCFKSGNAAILRGGSEALNSNKILSKLFTKTLNEFKINKYSVQFIANKDRKFVNFLLSKMNNYIDVVIPRGGKNLVSKVIKLSNIPIIGHLEGICHVYIDKKAKHKLAIKIISNSKLRKTSNCGAAETLLIDRGYSVKKRNDLLSNLKNLGCEIIADKEIKKDFKGKIKLAKEKDWTTEYLSPKISVKIVNNVKSAVDHINKYGTNHTDSVVTEDKLIANYF